MALFKQDTGVSHAVEVILHEAPGLPLATIDPNQMRQVFWNLLKNAAEAMPDGGPVDVEVRADPRVIP